MAYVSRITSHNNNGNTSATRHRHSTRVQLYTLLYSLQAKGPVHVRRSFAPHGRLLQAKTARSSCLPHGSIFTCWKLSIEAAAFPSEYCNAPRFVYRPRGRGRSGIAYIVSAAKGASSSKERPRKSKVCGESQRLRAEHCSPQRKRPRYLLQTHARQKYGNSKCEQE